MSVSLDLVQNVAELFMELTGTARNVTIAFV